MRVLHVIPALAERYGGPSRLVVEMCRALRQSGIEAEIATTDADGPGRLEVPLDRLTEYRGVPTRFFHRDFSEALKYSRGLDAWLREHIGNYDLVHIHAVFNHAPLAASRACRHNGIPYLVRPLGTLDPWSMGVKGWRKRLFWRLGAERMVRGAAAVQYTTEREMGEVEASLDLSRGIVIPNAVDLDGLSTDLGEEAFTRRFPGLAGREYILFLGRLHPKKRLEALIEGFSDLPATNGHVAPLLVLAGDGEKGYRQYLEELAANSPAAGRILFPGWLKGVEKNAVLRRARLFALASHDENFGISAVEAMACGVAVLVSTGVYLHEEISRAGAGWVWNGDPGTLAPLLSRALQEGNNGGKGERGRRLAEQKFSWKAVGAELICKYQQLAHIQHA